MGVAIGDYILDIAACLAAGCFDDRTHELRITARTCAQPALNHLMARGRPAQRELRRALFDLLEEKLPEHLRQVVVMALVPIKDAELFVPVSVGDYTDFYASVHHATNVGSMFRPDNPLLPNYKWIPIGYHGRASSIVLSGTPIRRPHGQRKAPNEDAPSFGAARSLDYELELGFFVGAGNELGSRVELTNAEEHMFGVCLLNDWSARDIQAWEYQPLGPFLAKNFASSISPWVVTFDALVPFRGALEARADGDPEPLDYLQHELDRKWGGIAITVEAWLSTARMRETGRAPIRLSRASALGLYWSMAQMLTHHASNGCNLCPGDMLGTGTISGRDRDARGCLLELTWRGAEPLSLPSGETRAFLEDGDEVIFRAHAQRPGYVSIGFGACRGTVQAVLALLAVLVLLTQKLRDALPQLILQIVVAAMGHAFQQKLFGMPGEVDVHLPEVALLTGLLGDGAAQTQGVGLAQAQRPGDGFGKSDTAALQLLAQTVHRGGIAEQPGTVGDLIMRRQQREGAVLLAGPLLRRRAQQTEAVQHGTEIELLLGQRPGGEVVFVGSEKIQLDPVAARLFQGAGQLHTVVTLALEREQMQPSPTGSRNTLAGGHSITVGKRLPLRSGATKKPLQARPYGLPCRGCSNVLVIPNACYIL